MSELHRKEKEFHDRWAESEDFNHIDVIQMNEAATAPEMRFITSMIGTFKGKKILDVGCGLGEASVYLALQGADVTSCDLSPGMLESTLKLAGRYGVQVHPHQSTAEGLNLGETNLFDVIYLGNLFHHVDIAKTLENVKRHLKSDGQLVSWDPLHYNPLIQVYRWIATETRTPDEHPLKREDLNLFRQHFQQVEVQYFWFFTLIVFVIMAVVQLRNPNRVRFWKVVVKESQKWEWIYRPLERIDRVVLRWFPFLGWLCWNVVITAKRAKGRVT